LRTQEKPVVALVTNAIYPYHGTRREFRHFELARWLANYVDVHVYIMQWWSRPLLKKDDIVHTMRHHPLLRSTRKVADR
jgi:hypothetical protein